MFAVCKNVFCILPEAADAAPAHMHHPNARQGHRPQARHPRARGPGSPAGRRAGGARPHEVSPLPSLPCPLGLGRVPSRVRGPRPAVGRVGQGPTWAVHCVGLGPVILGAHTTHPCGCVETVAALRFQAQTPCFATCATAPAQSRAGPRFQAQTTAADFADFCRASR